MNTGRQRPLVQPNDMATACISNGVTANARRPPKRPPLETQLLARARPASGIQVRIVAAAAGYAPAWKTPRRMRMKKMAVRP